jgi:flavorubredoxin
VKNEKTKVLVIFEDGSETLETIARHLKTSLADTAVVKTRSASEVAVSEILAADAYVFGVAASSAPAWTEIKRLLTGMNLAGRKAGFFVTTQGAADGLKSSFAPAELAITAKDLPADPTDGTSAWVKALIGVR